MAPHRIELLVGNVPAEYVQDVFITGVTDRRLGNIGNLRCVHTQTQKQEDLN